MKPSKTVNRAPKTPRKIRDIRPKRQLTRNGEKKRQKEGDDGWYQADSGGGEKARLKGVAAVNRLNHRFGKKAADAHRDAEEDGDARRRRALVVLKQILALLRQVFDHFQRLPRHRKKKVLLGGLILLTAWRSIYSADLDRYSQSDGAKGGYGRPASNLNPMGDGLSSLTGITDDDWETPSNKVGYGSSAGDTGLYGSGSLGSSMLGTSGKEPKRKSFSLFSKRKAESVDVSSANLLGSGGYGASGGGYGSSLSDTGSLGGSGISGSGSLGSGMLGTSGVESKKKSASPFSLFSKRKAESVDGSSGNLLGSGGYGASAGGYGSSLADGISGSGSLGNGVLGATGMESKKKSGSSFSFFSKKKDKYSPETNLLGSSSYGSSGGGYGSSLADTGGRGISGSGLLGSDTFQRDDSKGSSSSFSLFPKRKSTSMEDSAANILGGNGYDSSKGNSMQSDAYDFSSSNTMGANTYSQQLGGMQSQLSLTNSYKLGGNDYGASSGSGYNNGMQPQGFNSFQSNTMDTKTSSQNLGGMQSQISLSNALTHMQHQTDQSRGLRGQNSMSNSQSMTKSGLGSDSFQASGEYQQPIGNSRSMLGNYHDNDIIVGSSSNLRGPQSQYSHNQNQGIGFELNTGDKLSVPSQGGSSAGLQCENYGGPFVESEYSEIVYWRDIPADATFTSPYYNPQAQEAASTSFWKAKYLTFEMDNAGWNNMRLGLENVMLLAHSMGRTLVMPPRRQIAHGLMDKSGSKVVSFSDFYDIAAINSRQQGLNIITMETFLEREGLSGNLKSRINGEVMLPPNNQISWDNQRLDPLWTYIRNVTKTFQWNPKQCVLAFPAAGTDEQHLFSMMADVLVGKDGRPFPHYSEFQGRPVNVNAPPIERFREILAERRKICMYDRKAHEEHSVVHFKADQIDGTRLITQFYAFLWFEDWRHDLWTKRFIRDNLRYNNEIMCLSARIINALRNHAKKRSPGNVGGLYDTVHIRRGDFQQQFPMTEMTANDILAGLQEHIAPGNTLFIATNERDVSFFRPIQEVYDVAFLGDFGSMLSDINPNYYPLVEQIVASRGRIFIGTFFSTFSAYIARLRGYYSVKEKPTGYMTGGLRNTFFLPAKWKKEMHLYQAIHKPLYGRDFPVAWRDIDRLELPTIHSNKLMY